MLRNEITAKVTRGFESEIYATNSFRWRFLLMQNIKIQLPELPEYLIYYVLRDVDKQFNYKKNKDEFIQAFLNKIFSILLTKITE